jgi:arylsulfatase A-like enzyme
MAERPNIVVIMVDQWRGDCLSVAGHPVVQTPYLDQMALDGVRFGSAYSATPTCIPARAALLTGQTQATHGRVGYQDGVNWDYETTLAGEFTRHGYQTQAIGKMHVYPERSQMGFQNVILHDGFLNYARSHNPNMDYVDDYLPWLRQQLGRDADYFDHGVNCNSYVARPWDKAEELHPTNFVMTQGIEFLKRRDPRKPFMLFLSLHRPHPPYDPPAWAFEQYLHREMPDVPVGDWVDCFEPFADAHRPDAFYARIDPHVLQRARAGYYGHMTHIDHQVNRFIERLAEFGLRDNTYFLFTSDHGEMLGDHNLFRKAYPYEGSAHIPMLLLGPRGGLVPSRGVSNASVELRDVMPTLLDLAGLPIPDCVEGQSMLPLARGEGAPWRAHLHGEHTVLGMSLQWVTDGRWKYVWFSGDGREQLFDLQSDPQERHDLAAAGGHAAELGRWRQALVEALQGREEGFVQAGRLVPGRPVQPCLRHLRQQSRLE